MATDFNKQMDKTGKTEQSAEFAKSLESTTQVNRLITSELESALKDYPL